MVKRPFWIRKLESAWRRHSVVWLYGVRRVGKTFLCRSLEKIEYLDCELPRVRRMLEDPESFLEHRGGKRVVLDEIHRLSDPTSILKIAADHYPDVRILATGSSTLQASRKFRDTLTGRKAEIWLTPLTHADLEPFGNTDLRHRFHRGGLPPFFLAARSREREYQEWFDSYWAKDIMELFRLERRTSFMKLLELLLVNSGAIFEATRYARPCEISRTTVSNYLSVLESTLVAHVVRPFSGRKVTEIVAAPKVYGFDTGFVCFFRGWEKLRGEDLGILWEHYVLNEIMARTQNRQILYWRDKSGHEVDFVIKKRGRPPVALECKWSAAGFAPAGVQAFRRRHPEGENLVVAQDVDRSFRRTLPGGLKVRFLSLEGLLKNLT
jgi:predicted AAA+ superfamily ATPase